MHADLSASEQRAKSARMYVLMVIQGQTAHQCPSRATPGTAILLWSDHHPGVHTLPYITKIPSWGNNQHPPQATYDVPALRRARAEHLSGLP